MAFRSPIDPADIPFRYWCQGSLTFRATDLVGEPVDVASLGALDGYARAALAVVEPGTAWRLAATRGDQRLLVRVISRSAVVYLELEQRDGVWHWSGEGDCSPSARFTRPSALGGFLRLHPEAPPPGRGTRSIHLLVNYLRLCSSEVRVMDRPHVVITPDAVLIAVPVRTRVNSDMCVEGPPVRLTVRLPQRLGDRVLYDAATLPIRRIRTR